MITTEEVTVYVEAPAGKDEICIALGDGPTVRMTPEEARTLAALITEAADVSIANHSPGAQT